MNNEKSWMEDSSNWAALFFIGMWIFIALYMGSTKELGSCEAKVNYLYSRLPAGIQREISGG